MDGRVPAHVPGGFAQFLHVSGGGLPSTGHQRETCHALGFIMQGMPQAFFFVHQVVHVCLGFVVRRLCTPLAVFRASSGLGINDGAHVELLRGSGPGYLVGSFV